MEAFREKFREEANELIADLEQLALRLEGNKSDPEIIEQVFRVMHSLKGGSAMFGFTLIDKFTHLLESVYDKIRNNEAQVTDAILDITLSSVDHLRTLLTQDEANYAELEQANAAMISRVEGTLTHKVAPQESETAATLAEKRNKTYFVSFTPSVDYFLDGSNPLYLLDDLWQLGQAMVVPKYGAVPSLEELNPIDCHVGWNVLLATAEGINAITDVFIFTNNRCQIEVKKLSDVNLLMEAPFRKILSEAVAKNDHISGDELLSLTADLEKIKNEADQLEQRQEQRAAAAASQPAGKDQSIASIRVSSEKLDNLIDWVSELVTIQAQLSMFAKNNMVAGLQPITEEIEKITRRLRDDVFSIRLIPVANMMTRFQRLVREVSHDLGKQVAFESRGTETELDKNIIEMLSDPIMHIIRNSLDHGIEASSEERVRAGKPAKGKILFNAFYSGANVYIQIIDDGRGIDPARVRQKAVEKGLVAADAQLTDKQIFDILFLPGFSTAKTVTNLSGRGVGMDVVRRKISDLRGQVEVDSQLGKGTTITIKLPLTLSIIDGLLVRIENTMIVVPLNSVHKVYAFRHEELAHATNNLILVDEERVPALNLREYFKIDTPAPEYERVVTVEYNEKHMGLTVDDIVGEYQAVLKPLGTMFKDQDFFSGATILGDGTVALVLDPNKLVDQYAKNEVKIGGNIR